jgi:hypothetical protein
MGGDYKKILTLKYFELQELVEYEEYLSDLEYFTRELNSESKKNNLL